MRSYTALVYSKSSSLFCLGGYERKNPLVSLNLQREWGVTIHFIPTFHLYFKSQGTFKMLRECLSNFTPPTEEEWSNIFLPPGGGVSNSLRVSRFLSRLNFIPPWFFQQPLNCINFDKCLLSMTWQCDLTTSRRKFEIIIHLFNEYWYRIIV